MIAFLFLYFNYCACYLLNNVYLHLALLDEEEDEEEEEEEEEDGEDGMSKAKLLQKKKKQQQRPDSSENTVKIAKKLTAKEKRHLEITGGKISEANLLLFFLVPIPYH